MNPAHWTPEQWAAIGVIVLTASLLGTILWLAKADDQDWWW